MVKSVFPLLLLFFSFIQTFAEAKLQFVDTVLVNDSIHEEDEYAYYHFRYTNIGDSPLYITSAKSECPCTVAEYSDLALVPGDTAVIIVRYQAKQRPGWVDKDVKVTYNSEDPEEFAVITIKGNVSPLKREEEITTES